MFNVKQFTQEMLDTLSNANRQVVGTPKYSKYYMETDFKSNNRWKFIGHHVPTKTGEIKTVKGKIYIITDGFIDKERYHVTDEVRKLLNL